MFRGRAAAGRANASLATCCGFAKTSCRTELLSQADQRRAPFPPALFELRRTDRPATLQRLLCFVRKRNLDGAPATKQPAGQIS